MDDARPDEPHPAHVIELLEATDARDAADRFAGRMPAFLAARGLAGRVETPSIAEWPTAGAIADLRRAGIAGREGAGEGAPP